MGRGNADPALEAQLAGIRRATVQQRLLQRFQRDTPKLPRRKPQPPNRLLREVPMFIRCSERALMTALKDVSLRVRGQRVD